jgi:hypothetical protein
MRKRLAWGPGTRILRLPSGGRPFAADGAGGRVGAGADRAVGVSPVPGVWYVGTGIGAGTGGPGATGGGGVVGSCPRARGPNARAMTPNGIRRAATGVPGAPPAAPITSPEAAPDTASRLDRSVGASAAAL